MEELTKHRSESYYLAIRHGTSYLGLSMITLVVDHSLVEWTGLDVKVCLTTHGSHLMSLIGLGIMVAIMDDRHRSLNQSRYCLDICVLIKVWIVKHQNRPSYLAEGIPFAI